MYLDSHCLWPAVAGDNIYWMTSQRIVQVSMSITLPAASFVPFCPQPVAFRGAAMSLEPRCATKFNNDATLCPALCPCLATRPYVASCLACSVSLRPLCMFIPLTLHLASCYDLMLHTHVPGCHGLFPVSYTASCLCSRCIP